jgi:hypothetical protein
MPQFGEIDTENAMPRLALVLEDISRAWNKGPWKNKTYAVMLGDERVATLKGENPGVSTWWTASIDGLDPLEPGALEGFSRQRDALAWLETRMDELRPTAGTRHP